MDLDEKSGAVVKGVQLRAWTFDFTILSRIWMFLLGVFVGAGFFIILGEMFVADPMLLSEPTVFYESIKNMDAEIAMWIFVLMILVPVLLNIFALLFRVVPILLTRFLVTINKKRLCFIKRFGREKLAMIVFDKPFFYERSWCWLGVGHEIRTPMTVHVFSQNKKAIAITKNLAKDKVSVKKDVPHIRATETFAFVDDFFHVIIDNWVDADMDEFILAAMKKAKRRR